MGIEDFQNTIGEDPTGAIAANAALRDIEARNPFGMLGNRYHDSGYPQDFMDRARGRAGGAMAGALGDQYSREATEAQWGQAPLTHGMFGFSRPSHFLDWRMRQQDEITRQHFANVKEREGILERLYSPSPWANAMNVNIHQLGQIPGKWEDILGGAESRMGRQAEMQMDDAVSQAAQRGMEVTPHEQAMMETNAAASQAQAMGGLQQQALQSRQQAYSAAGQLAGQAAQMQQMQDQALAQYGLGTLPEAVSLELMGAVPESDWATGQRQMVGTPWRRFGAFGDLHWGSQRGNRNMLPRPNAPGMNRPGGPFPWGGSPFESNFERWNKVFPPGA